MHLPKGPCCNVIATNLDENNSDHVIGISHNLASKRRKLTYTAAENIHSSAKATEEEAKAAARNGLWYTLITNTNTKEITDLCKKSKTFQKVVIPEIVVPSVKSFEKSPKNLIRSVSVLYRGGMLSKRKYSSLRSSEMYDYDVVQKKRRRMEFHKGCKVPAIVPYKDLMKFVGEQDIGTLHNIPRAKAEREAEKESEEITDNLLPLVPGHYIALQERLLQLADLYLHIESQRPGFLNWLGREKGHFLVAIGADGAPFGKANEACSWLVSFLNVMERVACPDDNFLLCGANCKEDHPSMLKYAKHLKSEVISIEKKTFKVKDQDVKFEVKLIPADMKWLSIFSGELNNAATYPCPFANVRKDELQERGHTLGDGSGHKWQPWSYQFRENVVSKVSKFKKTLKAPNNAAQTRRNREKICEKIAQLKSRQEFEPVLGHMVQLAKCDPLHLGNNCWGHWHMLLFNYVMNKAKIENSVQSVFQLPESNPLRKHLKALKFQMKCKKLYNKIVRWFKEKHGSSNFQCRFTGEETKKFCDGFMHLIEAAIEDDVELPSNFFTLSLSKMGIHLRDIISLASRVSQISEDHLQKLQNECKQYFNITSLFHSVNVSVWTVGHVVPFHTKQVIEDLGVGLGINSMQGRESKHQQVASFAEFSLVKNRWEKVFRHEYMSLIWLRKQNPCLDSYKKCKDKYTPERCFDSRYCICGLAVSSDGKCKYCGTNLSKEISVCAITGEITKKMRTVLKLA